MMAKSASTTCGTATAPIRAPRSRDWALRNVDLEWPDGGAYALLGPSGCGKTTLLNLISGLLTPTEGRVLFDERDVTACSPAERNIAQVFQFPVVYDTMTVYDNLAFPLRNRGVADGRGRQARARDRRRCSTSSRCCQQRAAGLTADGKQKISLGRGLVRSDVDRDHVRRAADRHRPAPEMAAALAS